MIYLGWNGAISSKFYSMPPSKVIHKKYKWFIGSSLTKQAHYPLAVVGEAILRGHCRDYNNNRVYVSSTACSVGRSVNAAWQTLSVGCPSAPCDDARLADRSGAKQFRKTLYFWRVVVVGGLTACDRHVEGEVSQEGDIQENMLGKHCISSEMHVSVGTGLRRLRECPLQGKRGSVCRIHPT